MLFDPTAVNFVMNTMQAASYLGVPSDVIEDLVSRRTIPFTRIGERPGALSGVFLIGYGIARIVAEFFREPDAFLGFLTFGITMGQILSLPFVLAVKLGCLMRQPVHA